MIVLSTPIDEASSIVQVRLNLFKLVRWKTCQHAINTVIFDELLLRWAATLSAHTLLDQLKTFYCLLSNSSLNVVCSALNRCSNIRIEMTTVWLKSLPNGVSGNWLLDCVTANLWLFIRHVQLLDYSLRDYIDATTFVNLLWRMENKYFSKWQSKRTSQWHQLEFFCIHKYISIKQ